MLHVYHIKSKYDNHFTERPDFIIKPLSVQFYGQNAVKCT